MPKKITEYELLISCPSDVKEELDIINEVVNTFNRLFGDLNNAKIVTKHWSKDSYPQSGDRPQKLLNEQFVMKCDAAVAVFWTRFGTPTDEYGSGTEEEVEELIKSGKQVFLYFSDCPVVPSKVDNSQYEKITAFRKKYKERGIFATYENLEAFKKDFLNHLTLYFVRILEGNAVALQLVQGSNLIIKGVNNGKTEDRALAYRTDYLDCEYIWELKEKAISLIDKVNNFLLPIEVSSEETSKVLSENQDDEELPNLTMRELDKFPKSELMKLSKTFSRLNGLYPLTQVAILEKDKLIIDSFVSNNSLSLNHDFYNLGNLSESTLNYSFGGFGSSKSINGTDEEKNKYSLINELIELLEEYDDGTDYFSKIDNKKFVSLALCNSGKDYDEDIDIKLYIEKGYLCHFDELPIPEFNFIDIGIECFELIYKPEKTVNIDEYPDYYIKSFIPQAHSLPINFMGGKSYEEQLRKKTEEFNEEKEKLFCYEYFSDDQYEIVCYNQKYLKQNTNSFLPSYLVFNKIPQNIKYKITSKRYPDVVKGELIIEDIKA